MFWFQAKQSPRKTRAQGAWRKFFKGGCGYRGALIFVGIQPDPPLTHHAMAILKTVLLGTALLLCTAAFPHVQAVTADAPDTPWLAAEPAPATPIPPAVQRALNPPAASPAQAAPEMSPIAPAAPLAQTLDTTPK
jgi:hypothetical protein